MRLFALPAMILAAFVQIVSAQPITIAGAISLKEVLTQISTDYEKSSNQTTQLLFGSSGQLAAQITQGAPVDVFVSAGTREMDQLVKKNLVDPTKITVVCGNEVVLVVPADAAWIPTSISDLADSRIKRIAVGQPATVPAGLYAQQVLTKLQISDQIAGKLVYGENVRQVLDYVARGEVDAGMVYATDAIAAGGKVRVAARATPSMHQPIRYVAGVIDASPRQPSAQQFIDYLGSESAQQILAKHGFVVSAPTTAPAS
jgi:molybdate transport system substrate-binding protein